MSACETFPVASCWSWQPRVRNGFRRSRQSGTPRGRAARRGRGDGRGALKRFIGPSAPHRPWRDASRRRGRRAFSEWTTRFQEIARLLQGCRLPCVMTNACDRRNRRAAALRARPPVFRQMASVMSWLPMAATCSTIEPSQRRKLGARRRSRPQLKTPRIGSRAGEPEVFALPAIVSARREEGVPGGA